MAQTNRGSLNTTKTQLTPCDHYVYMPECIEMFPLYVILMRRMLHFHLTSQAVTKFISQWTKTDVTVNISLMHLAVTIFIR